MKVQAPQAREAPPTPTGGRSAPVRPQSTTGYLVAAAVLALVALTLCQQLAAMLLAGAAAQILLGVALPVAALGWPLGLAYRRGQRSGRDWAAGRHVEARRAAAGSRDASVTSLGISACVAILAALALLVFTNDGAVQKTFFNGEYMSRSFLDIVRALWINVQIALGAQILAMVFGLVLAIGRQLPGRGFRPVRALSIAYIDVFRGIPSVVLIYLVCYGLPLTEVPFLSGGSLVVYAIVALAMTYSAYNAELYRAGIESINPGQSSAALSMGLTQTDVMRFVILPQMGRNIAAPMLSTFIGLQKDTALVIVVGIIDAFSQAKIYSANDFNLSAVTAVCLVFVLITIPQTRFVDYLLARTGARKTGV
ncbi:amino acid ABC transporter membrane protein, PAAT family [Micromonospora pallida]|uniref:Amino acid ABC transporter membrane protein, PAAT family n=1 Tax=Micromonospora pallida TaxID=145854 RepID=A0A1C6S7N4_9ACTN|nr:amino acid ABC transporter permease [Micromonospora pallida]SCL25478.1 amino acid ABC transporter membrane protein, PAAT family [Micromonospora pallida]